MIAPDNVDEMVEAMLWISNADPEKRVLISERSAELAKQYTPQRMAENLIDKSAQLLPEALRR